MSPSGRIPQGTILARSNRVCFGHEVVCRRAERKEGETRKKKRQRARSFDHIDLQKKLEQIIGFGCDM